jgi:PilZ domain
MKRAEPKPPNPAQAAANERRKLVRATLVGSALVSPKGGAKAITAVLDNVNRVGAGLHAKDKLANGEKVTVSLAFLDSDRVEQQEKLVGTVAWVKPWEEGFLIGVVWDEVVTKEKNKWLYYYLEETIKSSP